MNKFYMLVVALVLVATTSVRAEEPVAPATQAVEAAVTKSPAMLAFEAAEAKRVARMQAAADRAGLSFWEARQADAQKVWNGTKWVSCKVGQGITNADGYTAATLAYPAGYAMELGFGAAVSCKDAAASIK